VNFSEAKLCYLQSAR